MASPTYPETAGPPSQRKPASRQDGACSFFAKSSSISFAVRMANSLKDA
jgi:hypothetical protein